MKESLDGYPEAKREKNDLELTYVSLYLTYSYTAEPNLISQKVEFTSRSVSVRF